MAIDCATDFGSTALAEPGPRPRCFAHTGLCLQGSRLHTHCGQLAQLACVEEKVWAREARSTLAPGNDSELGGREGVHARARTCACACACVWEGFGRGEN